MAAPPSPYSMASSVPSTPVAGYTPVCSPFSPSLPGTPFSPLSDRSASPYKPRPLQLDEQTAPSEPFLASDALAALRLELERERTKLNCERAELEQEKETVRNERTHLAEERSRLVDEQHRLDRQMDLLDDLRMQLRIERRTLDEEKKLWELNRRAFTLQNIGGASGNPIVVDDIVLPPIVSSASPCSKVEYVIFIDDEDEGKDEGGLPPDPATVAKGDNCADSSVEQQAEDSPPNPPSNLIARPKRIAKRRNRASIGANPSEKINVGARRPRALPSKSLMIWPPMVRITEAPVKMRTMVKRNSNPSYAMPCDL